MLVVIAKISVKNGTNNEFLEKTEDLVKNTRLEDGNIDYDVYTNTEDSNVFVILEKWENPEVLEEHMQSAHFIEFAKNTEELLAEDIDINVYPVNG